MKLINSVSGSGSDMEEERQLRPLLDLEPYERYKGSFPGSDIARDEKVLLEWRPSKALLWRGHPLLAFLMFPGAFTIPFTILIPILAFLGVLGFMLRHFYQIGFVLILIVISVVYGSGALAWWRTYYALTDHAVYVRIGTFSSRTRRTDFKDIIEIKIEKTIYERLTGRGTIVFLLPGKRFRKFRKVKWFTINHPEEVSEALSSIIFGKGNRKRSYRLK